MANQKTKQRQLFRLYAQNFSFHEPTYQNVFICPLCFRGFDETAVDNGLLSIEHIIPSSIGGKLETLTCKDCNNQTGSKLDAHLKRRISSEDILHGLSDKPLRGTVQIGDGEFRADIKLSLEQIEIAGLLEHSNPVNQGKAVRKIEEGIDTIKLHANLGFTKQASLAAIVRSAYLIMFYYFGYGYIKFNLLDNIRRFLMNPINESNLSLSVIKLPAVPAKPIAVSILRKPAELQCFFITLDLSTAVDRFLGVMLPGLKPEGNEFYNVLSTLDNPVGIEYDCALLTFRHALLDTPDFKDYVLYAWHKMAH